MFLNPEKSFSLFSDKGKISQCDNALTAALNSSLSLGCCSKEGSVLISHKKLSNLVVKEKYQKVFFVCPTIGVTYSGLQPDFRIQLELAQKLCQEYFDVYQRFPYLDVFINEFSLIIQEYSQKGGYRPFGTFLIFTGGIKVNKGGKDRRVGVEGENTEGGHQNTEGGHQNTENPQNNTENPQNNTEVGLFQIDPSGSFKKIEVAACGVDYESARKFVTLRAGAFDDNLTTCVNAIKEFSGENINPSDISLGVFKNGTFYVYNQEEIEELF